jgi:molybdopterin molybdotransferase
MAARGGSFLKLQTPEEAREILRRFPAVTRVERLDLADALGRVLTAPLASPEDHPTFARASMDGFAVRAADTFGAGEGLPAMLRVAGAVAMGAAPTRAVEPGEAIEISTGAALPPGADAVVMMEHTEQSAETIEIVRAVGVGENVVRPGDDVHAGDVLVPAGRRLRAADLAILAAVGKVSVTVLARPLVAILSTGDELVAPQKTPGPAQVRDVNAVALAAQVFRAGGTPVLRGIVRDDAALLEAAVRTAMPVCDLLLLSGGSSAGTRDLTADVLDRCGPPGVLAHGIAVAPGKPTILAAAGDRPLIGMPGYPVSSIVIFELFVAGLVERLGGVVVPPPPFGRRVRARLAKQIASKPGREDWVRVTIKEGEDLPIAEPVRGGTAVISSIASADGFVRVGMNEEGIPAGAEVEVCRFE